MNNIRILNKKSFLMILHIQAHFHINLAHKQLSHTARHKAIKNLIDLHNKKLT